jgi:hypothetical protein
MASVCVGSVFSEVSEMERTFAGFWVDGAVREPEDRHTDGSRGVLVKVKDDNRFERFTVRGGAWDKVYWLDTTTPTELTPRQAFDLVKVLYPRVTQINSGPLKRDVYADDDAGETIVNWNGTTEYPSRERWRVPTDADKGRKCRAWDVDKKDWTDATFIATWSESFIVRGGYWPFPIEVRKCEVLE